MRLGPDGALKRLAAAEAGTSAIEFALLCPVLLVLLLGVMEFGRALWTREALQQTATQSARCMGLVQTACGSAGVYSATMTKAYVLSSGGSWGLVIPTSNVSLDNANTCGGLSGFSKVTVTYTFTTFVPALIKALAGGTTMTASACFPNHG